MKVVSSIIFFLLCTGLAMADFEEVVIATRDTNGWHVVSFWLHNMQRSGQKMTSAKLQGLVIAANAAPDKKQNMLKALNKHLGHKNRTKDIVESWKNKTILEFKAGITNNVKELLLEWGIP